MHRFIHALALALLLPPALRAQQVRTIPLSAPLGTPDGITVARDGSIYVADYAGGAGTRVLKVDRAGAVRVFADGFAAPDGLIFDRAGNLYVSSFAGGTIHRVTPDGEKRLYASGLDHPSALAFDADGVLYVSEFGNFDGTRVSRITPDGTVSTFATGVRTPLGLAFGPDGMLYVSSFATGEISRIARDGRVERFAAVGNTPVAQLQYLAFDSKGTLYVPSLGHNVVYAIDRRGTVRTLAGDGVAGDRDGSAQLARFHTPNSIHIVADDTIIVTEFASGRLRVIAPAPPAPAPPAVATARRARAALVADLGSDTARYTAMQHGSRTDSLGTVTMMRHRRGDTLFVEQLWETRLLSSRDTILLDARTLRPFARVAGPTSRRTFTRYRRDGITMHTRTASAVDTLAVRDTLAYEAASLDILAAALPFTVGSRLDAPLFAAAQRGVVWSGVHVRAPRTGEDPSLTHVEIAYPSAIVSVAVARRTRRVQRIEYDYGARRLVLERMR